MKTNADVLELLKAQSSSPIARRTSEILRHKNMKPVADEPASVTVSEALRLWKTRLSNIPHTGQPIEGINELIGSLELLTRNVRSINTDSPARDLLPLFFQPRQSRVSRLGYCHRTP